MNIHQRIYRYLNEGGSWIEALSICFQARIEVPRKWQDYTNAMWVPSDPLNSMKYRLQQHLNLEALEVGKKDGKTPEIVPTTPVTKFPPEVQLLKVQGAKAYDHYENLKTHLREADSDKTRYQIAVQIINWVKRIDSIYGRIREWEQTGTIPFVLDDNVKSAIDMMLRMNSLKSRISRLKKQNSPETITELEGKTRELEEIKKKLNL